MCELVQTHLPTLKRFSVKYVECWGGGKVWIFERCLMDCHKITEQERANSQSGCNGWHELNFKHKVHWKNNMNILLLINGVQEKKTHTHNANLAAVNLSRKHIESVCGGKTFHKYAGSGAEEKQSQEGKKVTCKSSYYQVVLNTIYPPSVEYNT